MQRSWDRPQRGVGQLLPSFFFIITAFFSKKSVCFPCAVRWQTSEEGVGGGSSADLLFVCLFLVAVVLVRQRKPVLTWADSSGSFPVWLCFLFCWVCVSWGYWSLLDYGQQLPSVFVVALARFESKKGMTLERKNVVNIINSYSISRFNAINFVNIKLCCI